MKRFLFFCMALLFAVFSIASDVGCNHSTDPPGCTVVQLQQADNFNAVMVNLPAPDIVQELTTIRYSNDVVTAQAFKPDPFHYPDYGLCSNIAANTLLQPQINLKATNIILKERHTTNCIRATARHV